MKPKLQPPGIERLKRKCDLLLSTSAFPFNLRRYTKALSARWDLPSVRCRMGLQSGTVLGGVIGRGLHSSTYQLNLIRF